MTSSTLYGSASTSKSFTAAAAALLVQDDKNFPHVQWDTPVSRLLPEDFVMEDDMYTQIVTIEDILSHTSGLPGHDDLMMGISAAEPDNPPSITGIFAISR